MLSLFSLHKMNHCSWKNGRTLLFEWSMMLQVLGIENENVYIIQFLGGG